MPFLKINMNSDVFILDNARKYIYQGIMKILWSLLIVLSLLIVPLSAQAADSGQLQDCCIGKAMEKSGGDIQDSIPDNSAKGDCIFHCSVCADAFSFVKASTVLTLSESSATYHPLDVDALKGATLSGPDKPPRSV